MSAFTSKALNKISVRTSLTYDTVKYCLECAIEEAVCEFFGVRECDVDLDEGTVIPTFHVGSDMEMEEAELFCSDPVCNDLVPAAFTFEMFHRDMVDKTLELFEDIIREVEADELEKKWRKEVHKAVEGVIKGKSPDRVEVNLGEEVMGVMWKAEWIPREADSYREGKLLFFYVLKAVRRRSAVDVHLSRASIGLPGAILKTMAPWVRVKPMKRVRGRKTWLHITPPVPTAVLREVSAKLNGEVIDAA
jgi:hypothetical protein